MKTTTTRLKHAERALRELRVSDPPRSLLTSMEAWVSTLRDGLQQPSDKAMLFTPSDDDQPIVAETPTLNPRRLALGRRYKLTPIQREVIRGLTGATGLGGEVEVIDFDSYPNTESPKHPDGVWRTAKLKFGEAKRRTIIRLNWADFASATRTRQAYLDAATPAKPAAQKKVAQKRPTINLDEYSL